MTRTTCTTWTAATAIAATLTLAGCAATAPISAPSAATASSPTPVETIAPVETPAPVAVTATSPAGTEVPADQVDTLRGEGAHIYDPVGSGQPVIVTTGGAVDEVVLADIRKVVGKGGGMGIGPFQAVKAEFELAGISGFFIYETEKQPGDTEVHYMVRPANIPGTKEFFARIDGGQTGGFTSKDAAIAEMQGLMDANPTAVLVDLTL